MTTPIPSAAIGAEAPTSRATFRLIARGVGATNRDADTLRHALLAHWSENDGTYELVRRLSLLDQADPAGDQGVEGRLAVWFSLTDRADGQVVSRQDPLLDGLGDELRDRLAAMTLDPSE